jgi:hypothetical protein
MRIFAAEEFHDIAPPVDYTLLKPWVVISAVAALVIVAALVAWLIIRWRRRKRPQPTPRERALQQLARIAGEIEKLTPYQFSIRVSDILRSYVTEQYDLPVTRQTSVEFLATLAPSSPFSEPERLLLSDFLNRCDLIKFARFEATVEDSRSLLEEANNFVRGGQLVTA